MYIKWVLKKGKIGFDVLKTNFGPAAKPAVKALCEAMLIERDYEIREGKPDYTGRIVVIGSKMDEHRIEELFFGGK